MHAPRVIGFVVRGKADTDHAGDVVIRISRTGCVTCLNSSPTCWFSRKKNSVGSSSFGSEFTAMKKTCEYLRGFKHKLHNYGNFV